MFQDEYRSPVLCSNSPVDRGHLGGVVATFMLRYSAIVLLVLGSSAEPVAYFAVVDLPLVSLPTWELILGIYHSGRILVLAALRARP